MEGKQEFLSYKKLMVFGTEGVGKTTFTKILEKGSFSNESHSDNTVIATRLSGASENSKNLHLNLYEVRINDTFIKDKETIRSFLYECQCGLFMVDITNPESFREIKELMTVVKSFDYPYLKKILVINKLDLESTRAVTSFEVDDFMQNNSDVDKIEISLKNSDGLTDLLTKINKYVNESNNQIPSNIVSEAVNKKLTSMNGQGSLSFILVGDSTVGKTCFLTRYFKNQFNETFLSTIGIDKETKFVKVGEENYKMTLWDTAGQDRFKCLPKKYYQNADGVFLLFDVTNEDTFNNVSNWMNDVKVNSGKSTDENKEGGLPLFLIGNKIDLPDRVVTREQAEASANSMGMKYFEVSCKINMNIPEVMSRMIMECHMKANHIENCFQLSAKASNNAQKQNGGCCGGDKNKSKAGKGSKNDKK